MNILNCRSDNTFFMRIILSLVASVFLSTQLEAQLQHEMIPLWKKITCNVIVIQGQKDNLVSPANSDFAKKMLLNASSLDFVIKDNMNHFVPWQHPELIRDAILKLLDKK